MTHPFGDLISQHLHRRHGLSQAKLAEGILQDPSIIGKMCKGQRLNGSQARERVVAIIGWLRTQAALETVTEANALLAAAGMSSLREDAPVESRLRQQLHLSAPAVRPPPARPPRKTNLPAPLTSFVGRAREMEEIAQSIKARRLVTLSGAGGVGKTRLAVEVGIRMTGEDNASAFTDGVWLVELAALAREATGGAQVTQAIAALFQLSAQTDRATHELLQRHLAGKHLLLILDNCEHLVEVCAELAEGLLQHCWQLHILATSREELRIPGETVYPVLPLALPNPAASTRDGVLASAAAQLFVERMGVTTPMPQIPEEEVTALAHICRQLDGIPLALELAAPLARSLTLAEIASQLDDQMAILTNSYRTAIPRHQTMHSALIWSYRLLAPAEQQLLVRLSVFAGGWTLEASQSVCMDDPAANLPLSLQQLVTKSWVMTENHDGQRRYRLLEPVRQFAHAQLVARREQEATLRRHALYFLALAKQMDQARDTPQEREWLGRLEPERDNLRAVNGWALERNEAEFAQRFNGSLFAFWIYRSSLAEANHWLEAAVTVHATKRTIDALSAEASALDAAGYAAALQHNFAQAQAQFERELALWSEIGDQPTIARALRGCAFVAMMRDDLAHAQQYAEEAMALSRTAQDTQGVAWGLFDLGYQALIRGELSVAQAQLEEALPQLREQGITFGAFRTLIALGHILRATDEMDRARAYYREAFILQQSMHYLHYVADGLEGLAGITAQGGAPAQAAQLLAAAHAHRERIAMPRWHHQEVGYERDVASARNQLAAENWNAAWAAGYALPLGQAVEYALEIA